MKHVAAEVCRLARLAGELIEDTRSGGFEVEHKSDRTLCTVADRRADAFLRTTLRGVCAAGWLSEESADAAGRLAEERVWVVDPLDGTREFVQGVPEYSVAIALVERGEPVLGVVHNPATQEMFWAVRGCGAFSDRGPIHIREQASMLASRSEAGRGEFAPFAAEWNVTSVGSIQWKLALVAAGRAGVTLSRGPKHEWDVCAGALLVTEAGGRATELMGAPLHYNRLVPKVRGVLAGAPRAYSQALRALAAVGPSVRMAEMDTLDARIVHRSADQRASAPRGRGAEE